MFSQLKIYPPETTEHKGLSLLTFPILLLVSLFLALSSTDEGHPDTQIQSNALLARLIVDIQAKYGCFIKGIPGTEERHV